MTDKFLKLKKSSDKANGVDGAKPTVTITADKDCPKEVIGALIEVADKIIKSKKRP